MSEEMNKVLDEVLTGALALAAAILVVTWLTKGRGTPTDPDGVLVVVPDEPAVDKRPCGC